MYVVDNLSNLFIILPIFLSSIQIHLTTTHPILYGPTPMCQLPLQPNPNSSLLVVENNNNNNKNNTKIYL